MAEKYYKRYYPNLDLDNYDHIVVGSGMAGLTAAIFLAKAGYKVLVLEQHYRPGGFTHSFKRKNGYFWDVGVHYIGNVDKGEPLRPIFDYLTNGELEWESMGEIYDKIIISGDVYDFYKGKDNHQAQLINYFPEEKTAIEQYFKLIEKVAKINSLFFLEKTFKPILSKTIGWFIRKYHARFAKKTTLEVLQSLTKNKRLIAVLTAQFGDYGLPPSQSSFIAHAMVISHFLNGGNYPKGGADQINVKMTKLLTSLGSTVLVNAKVDEIVVENNKVQGVRVGNHHIPSKSVFSNVGVKNTFNTLLKTTKTPLREKLNTIEAATAHLCLYVGLNKSDKELNLPKHNIWYHKTDDFDKNIEASTVSTSASNFAYISFPSAKDTKWQENNPNKATIQAIALGDYTWFAQYEELKVMKRGAAYEALKKQFEQNMLEKLYDLLPQIKGHVELLEVSTPLSTKHYMNYQSGEIYGLAHNPQRFLNKSLRFETDIKGLILTGQDLTICGVGGAMAAGMLSVVPVLKFKTFKVFGEIGKP